MDSKQSMSTNAVSTSSVKVSPRKKFPLASEIRLALRRYKLLKSKELTVMLDSKIVSTIMTAYKAKYLWVSGTKATYNLPIYTKAELLEYLKVLPLPEAREDYGARLRNVPLFSGEYNINLTCGKLDLLVSKENIKIPMSELKNYYKTQEKLHKDLENHHPDGMGWRSGGIQQTVECIFDILNSLLRTNSLMNAYSKLFNILLDDKFSNLDNNGIFYAFLHMSIRGVAKSDSLYKSGDWRREVLSQELLFKISREYSSGIPPNGVISRYINETRWHMQSMGKETLRLRIGGKHDATKLYPESLYAYSWYWGIYQRMSTTNKYRFDAGIFQSIEEHNKELGECNPTMWSMGHGLASGMTSSPAVQEVISLIKELPSKISEQIDSGVTKFGLELTEQQSLLNKNAEMISENVAERHKEVGSDLLNQIVEKSEIIGKNLSKSFEPLMEAMSALTSIAEGVISKVREFLKPLPGFSNLKLDVASIMQNIMYYVLYINTDSTALKTILAILILNGFGLLKSAYGEMLNFWSWMQNIAKSPDGELHDINETSNGIFDWLASSPTAIVKILAGIIANMVKGFPLTSKEFFSLSKKLADNLKNFHFISQGIGGIMKLFDYCKKAYHATVEWISLNILGRTPEKEELAKSSLKLTLKVKYFHTEAGLNAIRMSETIRKKAAKLMPEYLALQATLKDKGSEYRHLYNDLEKVNRQVKEVADFVTRLENISNFQPTMFHIQFVGRPGIGKSTITKNLVTDLSKTLWPEESQASFYSYNTDLEYFDGYAGQKIMVVDDLYKINDPKHLTASMFLVTNTPVILPMANLNDKGVQLTSEVLISSTNTAYPLGKDVLCMEAIHRRRHMLVEVQCDPSVLDKSLGQFSMSLFKEKYGDANPQDFPHLTFNLLRPVPEEFGGAMTVDSNEFDIYNAYANKLKEANIKIAMGDKRLDPLYYFSENNKPPPGITLPATGWTYKQFISNCSVRFAAFRGAEGTYSTSRKYAHVDYCLTEIDSLLDQHSDIEGGVEIPITKGIEHLLCSAQHPFGTTDEIGSRLMSDNPAPELDNIDLDEIVNNIIDESNPTGLTLTEEQIRTENLLRRRGKIISDPILRDVLKVEKIGGKKVIALNAHFTSWYNPPTVDTDKLYMMFHAQCCPGGLLSQVKFDKLEAISNPSFLYAFYEVLTKTAQQNLRNSNNFLRWALSHDMIYPDNSVFPDNRGRTTGFPISFFKDLTKIGNQWYLDVTNIEFVDGISHPEIEMVPYEGGPIYKLPTDIAFILSTMPRFRQFVNEFDNLSSSQQTILVQDAKWRSQYFGTYTYEAIANDCNNIFSKFYNKTLHYVCTPVRYFAEKYPFILAIIGYCIAYFAIIYTITKICELFSPRPTSKFLHRTQIPASAIHLSGRPTSAQNSGSSAYANLVQSSTSMLSKNVRELVLTGFYGGCVVQSLLTEQYIIFNKHCLKDLNNPRTGRLEDDEISISVQSTHGDKKYVRYLIEPKNIYADPEGDLAIIYSKSLPSVKSISKMFISKDEFENHDFPEDLIFLTNTVQGGAIIDHHSFVKKMTDLFLENKRTKTSSRLAEAVMVSGSTVTGRSGSSVVTSLQGRPKIIGIQAWEANILVSPKIIIQVVTLETFQRLTEAMSLQIGETPIKRMEEPEDNVSVSDLGECRETSAFQQVPIENVVEISPTSVGIVGKSQIKPSIIYDYLIPPEGPLYVPAALDPRDRRLYYGGKIHPLAHSLGKYFRGNIEPFRIPIINYAKSHIINQLEHKLDKTKFRTLDIFETITGTREDGSNPMNLASSPGIPFVFQKRQRKGKKDYMEIDELGEVSHIDQEFLDGYETFLSCLQQRRLPYTRAYDFPKDELRPVDKALGSLNNPPKTRSVTCMNVYYILAWRQYTLDFWAAMHRAADGTIPFCPGMNPEGPDWNNLYHYLNKFPNAVDFDVSNWDGFLRADLFNKAIEVVKSILKLSFNGNNIIDAIAFEVMNSYIQFGGIIYKKDRGLVSGFPGTAEMNTLSHWLLIVYIYLVITEHDPIFCNFEAFKQNVSVAIYGDDIIITFSDAIKEIFNGKTIAEAYTNIGYPITSADKSQDIKESKTLLECSFLKSSWRELFPYYYVRKMDLSVMYNLVTWNRCKQDPIQQFYENYIDALRIAFSSGPDIFEQFQKTVNTILAKEGRSLISFDYIDFERDYYARYFPNSKTISYRLM
nr:MAG: RNA-dependent RNA polymerase [Wufeng shrew polycipivirus 2]